MYLKIKFCFAGHNVFDIWQSIGATLGDRKIIDTILWGWQHWGLLYGLAWQCPDYIKPKWKYQRGQRTRSDPVHWLCRLWKIQKRGAGCWIAQLRLDRRQDVSQCFDISFLFGISSSSVLLIGPVFDLISSVLLFCFIIYTTLSALWSRSLSFQILNIRGEIEVCGSVHLGNIYV
jgi:hypothetical protein